MSSKISKIPSSSAENLHYNAFLRLESNYSRGGKYALLLQHFSVLLMPKTGYWGVKCIILASAAKFRNYTHLLQYSRVT